MTRPNRLAIVYPRANIDTVPSLIGAAELFAEAGYEVDVFTYRQAGQADPAFASERIRLRALGVEGLADHSTAALRSAFKRVGWLPSVARTPLVRTYNVLGAGLAGGSRLAARARGAIAEREEEPYRCVIGVDPDGLALAHTIARGAPLGYYSLELLLSYELSDAADRDLKARERELSQQARVVIVQDAERARLLAEDNDIPSERLALVPNAPFGPARRSPNRYWHERFNLPPDARIVIHSGSLGDWTGVQSIVESAATWPESWVLVVHTRYDAESSSYVDGLRSRADERRVLFSLKPLPRHDYDALIDGADVGIAFYVSSSESSFTQRNVQTIGLSSGKLAYYLRAGLPVIVNRDSSIAPTVEESGIGLAVEGAADVGAALERVNAEYEQHSAAAMRFFDAHLDFRRAFADVVQRVDALG